MPKTVKASVCGAHIRAALHFIAPPKETRHYLAGVLIEAHAAGGVMLTATDGHALLRAYDNCGEWPFAPAIVAFDNRIPLKGGGMDDAPRLIIEAPKGADLCKIATLRENRRLLTASTDKGAALTVEIIDGSFPEVARVIPARPRNAGPSCNYFDAALVQRFGKAKRELTSDSGMTLEYVTHDSPMLVTLPGAPAFGVCMPLNRKFAAVDYDLPGWRDPSSKTYKPATPPQNKPAPMRAAAPAPASKPAPAATPAGPMNAAQKAWATRRARAAAAQSTGVNA